MIKLFSLPIAELECDNEILNGKLGKIIECDLPKSKELGLPASLVKTCFDR